MDAKRTISISEARKRIFEITDEVQRGGQYYTVTENGKPKAVILSADEFDSWVETLDIMKEYPSLEKDARDAQQNYEEGRYVLLEDVLAQEGFVKDTSAQTYETSRRVRSKRAKRSGKGNR